MSTKTPVQNSRQLREIPAASWVREMVEYYRRNGKYRASDLRKLLGDQNKSVEIGGSASGQSFFTNP